MTVPNAYAVIMAGGRGERFWPESRLERPKQLLRLLGDSTMIEQTVARLMPDFPPENIVIVTNEMYRDAIRMLLPQLPEKNVIGEPAARNTAPCVALAAAYVHSIAPAGTDPVIALFPSDAAIHDADSFRSVVRDCVRHAASAPDIVTIGIIPSFPATGYGYIEFGEKLPGNTDTVFHQSRAFREKPDAETAAQYLAAGNFRWNAGMFFASHSTLIRAFQTHAPFLKELHDHLETAFQCGDADAISQDYQAVRKISIDYAVMEKADNIIVAESRFDWDDVGSWPSMKNHVSCDENGNAVQALHAGLDTSGCVVFSDDPDHLVATIGLDDAIVVHTGSSTLVCAGKSAQKIGELLKQMSDDPKLKNYL